MLTAFEQLMEAKAAREVVRDQLVKTIRRGYSPSEPVDAAEIAGLLRADDLATEELRTAQVAYNQIHDSPETTTMAYQPPKSGPIPVVVDARSMTIRPEFPEGDDYFGLAAGSNGTGAITRRAVVEAPYVTAGHALTWVRSNGAPAHGVQYVPGDSVVADPWSGQP